MSRYIAARLTDLLSDRAPERPRPCPRLLPSMRLSILTGAGWNGCVGVRRKLLVELCLSKQMSNWESVKLSHDRNRLRVQVYVVELEARSVLVVTTLLTSARQLDQCPQR